MLQCQHEERKAMKETAIKETNILCRRRKNTRNERLSKIVAPLLKWYDGHARILPWRESFSPYAVWISEIMLPAHPGRSCQALLRPLMKAFPDLSALAKASETEVLKLWRVWGIIAGLETPYKAARLVAEKYDGSLPASFEELRTCLASANTPPVPSVPSPFSFRSPAWTAMFLRVVTRLTAENGISPPQPRRNSLRNGSWKLFRKRVPAISIRR